ncbi:hypothetical protein [Croceiramulus getboli]|nr:hypothetical protein P8624_14545 [Flavobacteriaceae bacterium YJPT1-3]
MERQIKMLWDFRGPNAQPTATHHEVHLKEYVTMKSIPETITGVEQLSAMHTVAFLVTNEAWVAQVREDLKPHRGQVYLPKK